MIEPARGMQSAIPAEGEADANAAVSAARAAVPDWARRDPADRGELLKAAARVLPGSIDGLAEIQTRENGKPLADSAAGVEAGIGAIEQYAEIGPLHRGAALAGARMEIVVALRGPARPEGGSSRGGPDERSSRSAVSAPA